MICAHTLLVYIGVTSQQEMRSFRGAGIHPLHYLLRAAYFASAVLSQPKHANIPDGCGPHCDVLHAKHTNPSTQFVREYISTVSFENWLLRFSTPHDLYVRQGLCAYPLYRLLGSTFGAILYSSATRQASKCIYRFVLGQCLPVKKQKQKQSGPWQITLAKNTRPLLIKEFVLPCFLSASICNHSFFKVFDSTPPRRSDERDLERTLEQSQRSRAASLTA